MVPFLFPSQMLICEDEQTSVTSTSTFTTNLVPLPIHASKYADFRQVTRQTSLPDPSSDAQTFHQCALGLLSKIHISPSQAVRLCGVSVSSLEDQSAPRQLGFDEEKRAKQERLDSAMDSILDRFGDLALARASHTKNK